MPQKFTILVLKSTSPLQTNTALNIPHPPQAAAIHPPSSAQTTSATSLPQTAARPSAPQPPSEPHTNISQTAVPPNLVERIRVFEDRSLRRLAPVTISETGRPRVLIPDEVFQRGEELHKNFIVCYFNGRPPPYSQIQSVLNHMWGKGGKLEIHNNPISRNMIVRIPSDYLRKKILEKGSWYVGDSMFHTAQWSSAHSADLVAGLVGEPVETDDITKNLVSLTLSHVKVEVNLTKELPRVVEFQRQSGEVVEVLVDNPWLPPTCSHCKELGHIVQNCLKVPLPPRTTNATPKAQVAREAKKKNVSSDQDTVFQHAHDLPNNKKNKEAASTSSTPDVVSNSENHPPVTPVSHSAILTARIPFPRSSSLPPLVPTTVPVNVRGLNDPSKHQPFCQWLISHQPIFGAILETHIKDLNLSRLMSKLCNGWSFTSYHSSDENGRIILIWRDPAKVRILHQSHQTLTCEHSNPDINTFNSNMIDFRDCLNQMGLFDLRFQDLFFTWTNCQPDSPVAKKIDRLLVNCHALSMFPNSTATFLPPLTSDHSPCLVDLAHQLPKAGTRPFKFYNYLTKHPNFHHLLQEAWFQVGSFGFTLTILCWKQKTIKRALKELNRENFSQIQVKVCEAYSLLQVVQSILAPEILPSMSISSPLDWTVPSRMRHDQILYWNATWYPASEMLIQQVMLSINNCEMLIQQIKSRITSWSAKSLSFAGRLLLIKTVIAGISTFWCASFILPKACIDRINSLYSVYLWKGNVEGHHSARVSWATSQGGLVWVAWYKSVVLKGSLNNFWTAKPHRKAFMASKQTPQDMFPWIKLRLGNGNNCRFWSDNWSPFGSIKSFIHSRRGITENAILSSLHHQGQWMLPSARSESEVSLQAYLTTIDLTAEDDYYEWVIDDQVSEKFRTSQIYKNLRDDFEEVPWEKIVWSVGGIPKHNFLTWLFILNRCPTRDRILGWGLQMDANCLLCNSCYESKEHIFFDCAFSWDIWVEVARRSNLQACRVWADSILQMQSLSGGKHANRLTLLGWQATIYWIWAERNARLHQQTFRSTETLITLIDSSLFQTAATMALDGDPT
ncbi:unnamed protein product, partial [Thlaspi arvense]